MFIVNTHEDAKTFNIEHFGEITMIRIVYTDCIAIRIGVLVILLSVFEGACLL